MEIPKIFNVLYVPQTHLGQYFTSSNDVSDTQDRIKEWGKYACPGYSLNLQPFVPQRSLIRGDAIVFLTPGWLFLFNSIIFSWHHCRREGTSDVVEMLHKFFFLRPDLQNLAIFLYQICLWTREWWSKYLWLPAMLCGHRSFTAATAHLCLVLTCNILSAQTTTLPTSLLSETQWCLLHDGKAVYILNAGSSGHGSVSKLTETELVLKYY